MYYLDRDIFYGILATVLDWSEWLTRLLDIWNEECAESGHLDLYCKKIVKSSNIHYTLKWIMDVSILQKENVHLCSQLSFLQKENAHLCSHFPSLGEGHQMPATQ